LIHHNGWPTDFLNGGAMKSMIHLSPWRAATDFLREELGAFAEPKLLDAAMHELTHVQDGLADLRNNLGLGEPGGGA
jgi:hypothetical protein